MLLRVFVVSTNNMEYGVCQQYQEPLTWPWPGLTSLGQLVGDYLDNHLDRLDHLEGQVVSCWPGQGCARPLAVAAWWWWSLMSLIMTKSNKIEGQEQNLKTP